MKKLTFSQIRKAIDGKGFIFALVMSVAAVGIATYIAYNSTLNGLGELQNNDPASQGDETLSVGKDQNGIEKDTTAPEVTTEEETEPANNFITPNAPRIMPVEGEVINPYSNGELVKSETLGVWQTHDGIDIAAAVGTEVKSATTGTVSEVFEDPLWGICVSIDHGDGYFGYYFGLEKTVDVVAGQEIEGGAVIGTVGATADIESGLEPHLHFAVKKNGEFISPSDFIGE